MQYVTVYLVRGHVLECLNAKTCGFAVAWKRSAWRIARDNNSGADHPTFWRYSAPWVEHRCRFCPKDGTRKDDLLETGVLQRVVFFFFWGHPLSRRICHVFLISMRSEGSASESSWEFDSLFPSVGSGPIPMNHRGKDRPVSGGIPVLNMWGRLEGRRAACRSCLRKDHHRLWVAFVVIQEDSRHAMWIHLAQILEPCRVVASAFGGFLRVKLGIGIYQCDP